jgi:hypothetical protein
MRSSWLLPGSARDSGGSALVLAHFLDRGAPQEHPADKPHCRAALDERGLAADDIGVGYKPSDARNLSFTSSPRWGSKILASLTAEMVPALLNSTRGFGGTSRRRTAAWSGLRGVILCPRDNRIIAGGRPLVAQRLCVSVLARGVRRPGERANGARAVDARKRRRGRAGAIDGLRDILRHVGLILSFRVRVDRCIYAVRACRPTTKITLSHSRAIGLLCARLVVVGRSNRARAVTGGVNIRHGSQEHHNAQRWERRTDERPATHRDGPSLQHTACRARSRESRGGPRRSACQGGPRTDRAVAGAATKADPVNAQPAPARPQARAPGRCAV